MDKTESIKEFKEFLSENRENLLKFVISVMFGGCIFHIQIKK